MSIKEESVLVRDESFVKYERLLLKAEASGRIDGPYQCIICGMRYLKETDADDCCRAVPERSPMMFPLTHEIPLSSEFAIRAASLLEQGPRSASELLLVLYPLLTASRQNPIIPDRVVSRFSVDWWIPSAWSIYDKRTTSIMTAELFTFALGFLDNDANCMLLGTDVLRVSVAALAPLVRLRPYESIINNPTLLDLQLDGEKYRNYAAMLSTQPVHTTSLRLSLATAVITIAEVSLACRTLLEFSSAGCAAETPPNIELRSLGNQVLVCDCDVRFKRFLTYLTLVENPNQETRTEALELLDNSQPPLLRARAKAMRRLAASATSTILQFKLQLDELDSFLVLLKKSGYSDTEIGYCLTTCSDFHAVIAACEVFRRQIAAHNIRIEG